MRVSRSHQAQRLGLFSQPVEFHLQFADLAVESTFMGLNRLGARPVACAIEGLYQMLLRLLLSIVDRDCTSAVIHAVLETLTRERKRLAKDINDHIDRYPNLKQDSRVTGVHSRYWAGALGQITGDAKKP